MPNATLHTAQLPADRQNELFADAQRHQEDLVAGHGAAGDQ
jgi:hypothetical protein